MGYAFLVGLLQFVGAFLQGFFCHLREPCLHGVERFAVGGFGFMEHFFCRFPFAKDALFKGVLLSFQCLRVLFLLRFRLLLSGLKTGFGG